jgi:hypothetical protein
MRVPDGFLKSVGFIGEVIHTDTAGDDFDPCGTGFFVSVPSSVRPEASYFLLVTAKHVVIDLQGRPMGCLVNNRSGGVASLPIASEHWYFHPSDPTADVAVMPFELTPNLDIVSVATKHFINLDVMAHEKMGIGDEVFALGLFTYAAGRKRNMPIVRHGNLAMIPEEQIQIDAGFADAYLIEARSIGGMSGSPVFIRKTVSLKGLDKFDREVDLSGVSSDFRLLGLLHGHWDIKESEINKPTFAHDHQRGVNLGIAVVVPAHKIMETINHPDLIAARERGEDAVRSAIVPSPDRTLKRGHVARIGGPGPYAFETPRPGGLSGANSRFNPIHLNGGMIVIG